MFLTANDKSWAINIEQIEVLLPNKGPNSKEFPFKVHMNSGHEYDINTHTRDAFMELVANPATQVNQTTPEKQTEEQSKESVENPLLDKLHDMAVQAFNKHA